MTRALLALTIGFSLSLATPGHAQTATCKAQSTEKKLAGAALTSFMKKCEQADAAKACDVSAKQKKLPGAAKSSFEKKCVSDVVGPERRSLLVSGQWCVWSLTRPRAASIAGAVLERASVP